MNWVAYFQYAYDYFCYTSNHGNKGVGIIPEPIYRCTCIGSKLFLIGHHDMDRKNISDLFAVIYHWLF